jgi:hypothetical protein
VTLEDTTGRCSLAGSRDQRQDEGGSQRATPLAGIRRPGRGRAASDQNSYRSANCMHRPARASQVAKLPS